MYTTATFEVPRASIDELNHALTPGLVATLGQLAQTEHYQRRLEYRNDGETFLSMERPDIDPSKYLVNIRVPALETVSTSAYTLATNRARVEVHCLPGRTYRPDILPEHVFYMGRAFDVNLQATQLRLPRIARLLEPNGLIWELGVSLRELLFDETGTLKPAHRRK